MWKEACWSGWAAKMPVSRRIVGVHPSPQRHLHTLIVLLASPCSIYYCSFQWPSGRTGFVFSFYSFKPTFLPSSGRTLTRKTPFKVIIVERLFPRFNYLFITTHSHSAFNDGTNLVDCHAVRWNLSDGSATSGGSFIHRQEVTISSFWSPPPGLMKSGVPPPNITQFIKACLRLDYLIYPVFRIC